MDKNSIIGYILIAATLLGFYYYTAPSEAELAASKRKQDSIALVKKEAELKQKTAQLAAAANTISNDSLAPNDSLAANQLKQQLGSFASAAKGTNTTYIIENELLKATIASKGGRIIDVELKKYKTDKKQALNLIDAAKSNFGLTFSADSKLINTNDLYFTTSGTSFNVVDNDSSALAMRIQLGADKYIEYLYSLKGNSYQIGCAINLVGMQNSIAPSNTSINLNWSSDLLTQEKSITNQRAATTIYYLNDEEVDYLSETSDEKETLPTTIKWVGFKQQYFTSTLIADKAFEKGATLETQTDKESVTHVKYCKATLAIPYGHLQYESFGLRFYYGPTHYQTLKSYGNDLEKQVPLGFFAFVNKWLVIPVFNFLGGFNLNYGIVILLLTVFIKLLLFPLTYKAYLSTAKMKVLKPEIDEINKKFEKNTDPMAKQQATMELYRKAGVNPFGGCLPMLLQMPILLSLFRFFPASIELRQQSFLWADDLSTYDSIYNLGFNIPFYGDHVSLFTLLMTVSTIIYTRMNSNLTGGADNAMQQQLKWMMYIMPIIFLGVFNNYSSGLSYYYFLANMMTFGLQYAMKFMVDEKAIHAKIEDNKKKPVKKSTFQQRLEEMAKQKGVQLPKK